MILMPDSDDDEIRAACEAIEIEQNNQIPQYIDLMPDSDDNEICAAYDAQHTERINRIPDNLLHLVENSPKEIEQNRLQAMMRRRNHANGGQAMSELIADRFYNVLEWPSYILKIVLYPDFVYNNRLALACFFVGNGLNDSDIALDIFKFYNVHWDISQKWNKRFKEFKDLFSYLNKPPQDPDSFQIRSTYFYYSVEAKQTLHLDGSIRRI